MKLSLIASEIPRGIERQRLLVAEAAQAFVIDSAGSNRSETLARSATGIWPRPFR